MAELPTPSKGSMWPPHDPQSLANVRPPHGSLDIPPDVIARSWSCMELEWTFMDFHWIFMDPRCQLPLELDSRSEVLSKKTSEISEAPEPG